MPRHSTRKAVKQMLHESGEVAGTTFGLPHSGNVYKRILPTVDVSICNQNPHRKLPNSNALVVGKDNVGRFGGVIPQGSTHGYWTTSNIADNLVPEDFAGSTTEPYVARTIFVFDLNEAGITTGDKLIDAQFRFVIYKSNTINASGDYHFDFHRVHPGRTGSGISGANLGVLSNKLTDNATWYEFDHSGTGLSGPEEGPGNYRTVRGFTPTVALDAGATQGANRWDSMGMRQTGSTADHFGDAFGGTAQWLDFSGGVSADDVNGLVSIYPEVTFSNTDMLAGNDFKIDISEAVEDARANYNNYLRFMIKFRQDDEPVSGTYGRRYITMHSTESDAEKEGDPSEEPGYAPSIHITYDRQ